MFVDALRYRNRYGLLAEDVHPQTGELWGNFPQTYSMAGLILTAMRLSRSWEDRYWRGWSSFPTAFRFRPAMAPARRWARSRIARRRSSDDGGVWFGWSGKVAPADELETRIGPSTRTSNMSSPICRRRIIQEYYNGFANRVLWPILHYRLDLAEFARRDLSGYFRVNEHFATELEKIIEHDDLIWVHDYHLIPLADALRRRGHANRIGFFLHVPFPAAGGSDRRCRTMSS